MEKFNKIKLCKNLEYLKFKEECSVHLTQVLRIRKAEIYDFYDFVEAVGKELNNPGDDNFFNTIIKHANFRRSYELLINSNKEVKILKD